MKSRDIARYALLTALALTLSWLESLVPIPGAPPGVKLGLGNLAVIFALYRLGPGQAAGMGLVRALLAAAMFGNMYSLAYSLAGAAVSLTVMLGLKRTGKFSILGVSAAGGAGHNIGQILVAMAALRSGYAAGYLPVLLVSGVSAGVAVGLAGGLVTERVRL